MQNSLQLNQDAQSTRLRDLERKAAALTIDSSVLRHLYFDDMYKRMDSVTDATNETFDWLLADGGASSNTNDAAQTSDDEDPGASNQWYEERRQKSAAKISEFLEQGGGVFFLRGKPGSGKSTLMKYLTGGRGKEEVNRKLRKWAGQKKLAHVSTMFLLHGTPLQRSLEGFYRVFFFELLCQCPDFTDILFPRQLTRKLPDNSYGSSFRVETLQEAWETLISFKQHDAVRICVSIDGMDELEGYSGDRLRFARILNEWAESEDIKIICSGRPNAEFNLVFNQPHQTIDLQDLTRPDIQKILMERFDGVRQFSDLTEDNIQELVDDISDQSEGVILWAVLVGKNIEDDIIHANSLSAMKRTIQTLPVGIEDLFNGMWQGLRQDAHQQLMLRTIYDLFTLYDGPYSFPALKFSWLEDALFDDEFPYNRPIQVLPADEVDTRLAKVRGQLAQHTKHFVEMTGNDHNCYFIHRSAQEFIQSKLDSIGSKPAPGDYIFHLDLRLDLILEMSIRFSSPTSHFFNLFTKPFAYTTRCKPHQRYLSQIQIQYRTMGKLQDLMKARSGSLSGDSTTNGSVGEYWSRIELGLLEPSDSCERSKTFEFFHLAVDWHQIDYVARMFNDRTQQLDREAVCLGLLICVAAPLPSRELFELLNDHGADPDYLVELHRSGKEQPP